MKRFKHIIYAGTFDRLHAGHKKMMERTFELAERVTIGITADEMVKGKILSESIEKIKDRRKAIRDYLTGKKFINRASIIVLQDIFGPSIKGNSFDSILVTELTEKNAVKINKVRTSGYESRGKRYLKPLKIIKEPLLRGEDGKVISSERIRMGEIDRKGNKFQIIKYTNKQISNKKNELILPEKMREELRKPLGKVIFGDETDPSKAIRSLLRFNIKLEQRMMIAVGDIITNSLLNLGLQPNLAVIDNKSRRNRIDEKSKVKNQISKIQIQYQKYSGDNFPGTINLKTAGLIKTALSRYMDTGKKQLIEINGEEDLLALPVILYAPLGSIVLYGQFDLGVVMVEVTEEKKKNVENLIKQFTPFIP